ncbi:efflux RND transporter permease subunit [Candidatus Spongiihabitans sp.]|uniref:efflux RND transporter permease subunit n=1 Tax=Candidatus Spongiihabitans sp. TaxID=3101308 RepID=UPI003C7D5261
MNIIRTAIDRPVAVIAAVLLVVLFGLVALQTIPIQLAPDVNRPVITVTTNWFGAAPAEVEREIINPQEEEFAGLEGLVSITGRAQPGRGRITLEFKIGTNMDRALLLVANRLDRVSSYPNETDQPTLDTSGSEDNAIAWMILNQAGDNDKPIHEYGDFVEDVVKERLERVPGIAAINVYGGSEREIHIVVDPNLLARYQLTVSDLTRALRNANISLGAGSIDEGKRRYVVRTESELDNFEIIDQILVRNINNGGNDAGDDGGDGALGRVTVADVADISFGFKEPASTIRLLGKASMALSAERQTGANVIETMAGLREAIDELNQSIIPNAGLTFQQVYDETVYINSSIDLVQQNIWVGGTLAAIILILFLRSFRAMLVISLAIPVSVIGAFVAMAALGRSINVISLAGLAFAVGMVVDAAIVVLENIYRLKEQGHSNVKAAYLGAQQVWGAILVSALTTVMVFVPILIMELEAGQLFRDIAVAISVSVLLSLLVSITVIPALSNRLFKDSPPTAEPAGESPEPESRPHKSRQVATFRIPFIDGLASKFVTLTIGFVDAVVKSRGKALVITAAVTLIAGFSAYLALPKLEYLPEGNRNLLFGIVIPPPGYNLETTTNIALRIENEIRPLWASESETESGMKSEPTSEPKPKHAQPPKIARFFYVATRAQTFLGAIAVDPRRVAELKPILQKPVFREPGTFGFITQPSIFGRGIGGGRKIDLDVSGPDLDTILRVSNRAFGKIVSLFPRAEGHEWRPVPGLELGAPEVRVIPNLLRLSDSGVTAVELAQTIDVFNDGMRITQSTIDGKLMDIVLKGASQSVRETQGIDSLPVVTPSGQVVPVSSLADTLLTAGPTAIRHRERLRTVTLEIRPNQDLALESAIDIIKQQVIAPLQQEGLPAGVQLNISGTADKLVETRGAMAINMMLALIIVYLVMAVLFESFVYPMIIMLAVPAAAAGGVGGLALLNLVTRQPLDMLTMLGFVILIGIVVNNAILLVHQTLHHIRHDLLPAKQAIKQATRNRIRPIFMSTLTSVFGMLPLVLFPGAGSELYRGLGSVVVGGLGLSAIITLLIIPPMMSLLVVPIENRRLQRLQANKELPA